MLTSSMPAMVDAAASTLEAEHGPYTAPDEAMIPLDQVVQVSDPHHLDRDLASKALEHSVDVLDAFSIDGALVDDDLSAAGGSPPSRDQRT